MTAFLLHEWEIRIMLCFHLCDKLQRGQERSLNLQPRGLFSSTNYF